MSTEQNMAIGVPGVNAGSQPPILMATPHTEGMQSFVPAFEEIKHLLSEKKLNRRTEDNEHDQQGE